MILNYSQLWSFEANLWNTTSQFFQDIHLQYFVILVWNSGVAALGIGILTLNGTQQAILTLNGTQQAILTLTGTQQAIFGYFKMTLVQA